MSDSLNSSPDAESKSLRAKVLSGSFMLLAGSSSVTLINFAYNIAVARYLGPSGFGHVSAVCTLLILISAITLSFQIVSAKIVAQQESLPAKRSAYRGFHRRAWFCGVLAGMGLLLFRGLISGYLNLPDSVPVALMAIGAAFYVPLGSRRGYLQGAHRFGNLAMNVVAEGVVRLGGSLLAIMAGYGVTGVIAANSAAVVVAYLLAFPTPRVVAEEPEAISVAFREGLQAIGFFVGAVIINNFDIVLVKHFFAPAAAGLYAAVALVGRVIYVLAWSVVSGMFPIAAGTRGQKTRDHGVLATSLSLVLAIGSSITLVLWLAPPSIWTFVFGSRFGIVGDLPYLLALYAATTSVYSLSIVFIAYEMSHKIANTAWVQLAFSGVLIASIYKFHSSLEQVIRVQLVMMVLLLIIVAVPFALNLFSNAEDMNGSFISEIRTIRRVSEHEVMAEFLKTDFHKPEFTKYQESLGGIVVSPNLTDVVENAVRRALLFVRHGALWRELPAGTQWFEVEIDREELERIRVFPRAQWRKLAARGNFSLTEVSKRIASNDCDGFADEAFLLKIQQLRNRLEEGWQAGAILLIGLNQRGTFTLLDGNHRMVAAMLASPEAFSRFRFFCGISPKMNECCWYETNVTTLARYGTNLLRHLVYDPQEELERLLQTFD